MTDPSMESQIRSWTPKQRAHASRLLDQYVERPAPGSLVLRRRQLSLVSAAVGGVVMVPWIGYLAASLPRAESGGAWRAAWVGFDVVLALVLIATAWLGGHRRQVSMIGLLIASTMLLTDAWFDVLLSWRTSEQWSALLSAVILEIPLALLLASSALAILRRSSQTLSRLRGQTGPPRSMWRQEYIVSLPLPLPPSDQS